VDEVRGFGGGDAGERGDERGEGGGEGEAGAVLADGAEVGHRRGGGGGADPRGDVGEGHAGALGNLKRGGLVIEELGEEFDVAHAVSLACGRGEGKGRSGEFHDSARQSGTRRKFLAGLSG
jgi:hypothetical protein